MALPWLPVQSFKPTEFGAEDHRVGWGTFFWLIWGLLSTNKPLIIANVLGTIGYALAIIVTIIYRRSSTNIAG